MPKAEWLSNGLCGLATGIGFTIRSSGTDDDETIFVAPRPVIVNGINDFVEKADLGDRSFFLRSPRIPESTRQAEDERFGVYINEQNRMVR